MMDHGVIFQLVRKEVRLIIKENDYFSNGLVLNSKSNKFLADPTK